MIMNELRYPDHSKIDQYIEEQRWKERSERANYCKAVDTIILSIKEYLNTTTSEQFNF